MSAQTFKWEPPTEESSPGTWPAMRLLEVWKAYEQAMTWKAPKNHATWCARQVPPGGLKHYHLGDTAMAQTSGCTCGQSATAKSLRKLTEMGVLR